MAVVAPPPGTTVTVARSVAEIEELRPVWERLQGGSLSSDIDYFLTVTEHNAEVEAPRVVVVEPSGREPTLLAAHLCTMRVPHRLGAWTPYKPRRRVLNVFRGVVGDPDEDDLEIAVRTLRQDLGGDVCAILFRNVEVPSMLHDVVTRLFPARSRQRFLHHRAAWATDISTSGDSALEALSHSTRANLRRTTRRLRRAFGDDLRVEIYDAPDDAGAVFRDIDAVAVTTYQTKRRPIFRDDELERELTLLGLEKGWFRAYVLYVGERPVSFWTGFAYAGTFGWRGVTGYDPAFRTYGVGKYLLSVMLDHLARDPTVRRVALGLGDLPYKRRFGGRGHEEVDVRVFSSRPRGVWTNYAGACILGVHAAFRAARGLPVFGHRIEAGHEGLKRRRR
jgi:CelD/BcsL family acetyltransferase involved in cellulose biosynthesis